MLLKQNKEQNRVKTVNRARSRQYRAEAQTLFFFIISNLTAPGELQSRDFGRLKAAFHGPARPLDKVAWTSGLSHWSKRPTASIGPQPKTCEDLGASTVGLAGLWAPGHFGHSSTALLRPKTP
ncbi:hypothetical protein CISG_00436 [Coccidioides immitis RMSCC 3703]|uniref:Uncharacterized protein n=2 Tax=Coccidioides immitis TaxID=5501 RepID=A0A0J8TEY3_COCIT|nr:hypothetical protein CIRG_07100 [Coccidioides immitis RMSCC 2394]KMU72127.1 hypothetical protein CISG_00436 [Coccidioides immitis RMSCC 3703]